MKNLPTATPDYVIFSSLGNDSIALIQWAHEKGLKNVWVAYCNTKWGSPDWAERVDRAEDWIASLGYQFHVIDSIGLEQLARDRKGWPTSGMQFCSYELKIKPSQEWLNRVDPDAEATCLVGVRREESRARATWPEWVEESENHGGRSLWSPLVTMETWERNHLVLRAHWEVLPHRSMECYPCVNANKQDLRMLSEERVAEIEAIEDSMGYTSKGNKRTMFRPAKKRGAIGIREVVKWAHSKRGEYEPPALGGGAGCSSGMCAEG